MGAKVDSDVSLARAVTRGTVRTTGATPTLHLDAPAVSRENQTAESTTDWGYRR